MRYNNIPDETIHRLPIYLRALLALKEQGTENLSSQELADLLGYGCYQVRKDLSFFGRFGKRGVGYTTDTLIDHIYRILKLDTPQKAALIGVGNLGSAILAYSGFDKFNFSIVAAFDADNRKVGKTIHNVTVENIKNISELKDRQIKFAVIATPESAARTVAEQLIEQGVTSILNFAPYNIKVPEGVSIRNIDIGMELACLPFMASQEK